MSFSLQHTEGSRPLALIKWPGSTWHRQTIYLSNDEPEEKKTEQKVAPPNTSLFGYTRTPIQVLGGPDFFKRGRQGLGIKRGDLDLMEEALGDSDMEQEPEFEEVEDRPQVRQYMQDKFKEAKQVIASRRRDFDLEKDGACEPLCNPDSRDVIFIVGRSGSGKSYWASKYIKSYQRTFKDHPVFVFSKVRGDPAFKDIPGLTFVPMDEKFVEGVDKGEAKPDECLYVFDDIDTISDKKVLNAVMKLRADLLETGRHGDCYILNTSHVFRGGHRTKDANRESSSLVLFPRSGDHYGITGYLKEYGGLTKDQIKRVMQLPSRWAMIHTAFPGFCLHEHGGFFLNHFEDQPVKPKKKSSKKA